jgi:hypothetical protein
MKRINFVLLATVMAALFLASFGLAITCRDGNVALAAASPAPTVGNDGVNLTNPQGCVKIALPLITGGSNCVANGNGTGGAIVAYLRSLLQLVGSAVGLVIVLMFIIAGIQYITSAGDSGRVKSAKDRIVGAITALILLMFMVAILQFLVPGGIL